MTAAQVSRATAKTIRLAFQQKEPQNAFFVLNSLQYSRYRGRSLEEIPQHIAKLMNPIDFGQSVSLRLSGHALLHGLVRSGAFAKAAEQAKLMMQEGVKLRTSTLYTVMRAAAENSPSSAHSAHQATFFGRSVLRPQHIDVSNIADAGTRYAVELLMVAREYRHRRTHQMFAMLIKAIALRGQLALAAALFALAVKDWQVQKVIEDQVFLPSAEPEKERELRKARIASRLSPSPDLRIMAPILKSLNGRLTDRTLAQSDPAFVDGAQALVTLTALIDERAFPFMPIDGVVKAITERAQLKGVYVWVDHFDEERRVDAYDYLHRVLAELIDNLPDSKDSLTSTGALLLPLDIHSYNSLIFYALRDRLSPSMANKVVTHMLKLRNPPLQPNTGTLNILLRAGTLLRQNDVAEQALRHFLQLKENSASTSSRQEVSSPLASKLQQEVIKLPEYEQDTTGDAVASLIPNTYTTVAYISYLIATGYPEQAAALFFDLFPELHDASHERWGQGLLRDRLHLRAQALDEAVMRGVILGPALFTALLNALVKSGKTGGAEHVWNFARRCERASWLVVPSGGTTPEPWMLPIAAYTLMLQCYAAEARPSRRRVRAADGRHLGTLGEKNRVKGWGWVARSYTKVEPSREESAKVMGMLILRQLRKAQRLTEHRLASTFFNRVQTPETPTPDERFFNAALRLFAKNPVGNALVSLAEEITRAGFEVPPAVQTMLAGIWEPSIDAGVLTPIVVQRTRARHGLWRARHRRVDLMRLQTWKDKGLP